MTGVILARSSSGNPAARAISVALASSMPTSGSTSMRASASGFSTARISISMPPSTLDSERKERLARSSSTEK